MHFSKTFLSFLWFFVFSISIAHTNSCRKWVLKDFSYLKIGFFHSFPFIHPLLDYFIAFSLFSIRFVENKDSYLFSIPVLLIMTNFTIISSSFDCWVVQLFSSNDHICLFVAHCDFSSVVGECYVCRKEEWTLQISSHNYI